MIYYSKNIKILLFAIIFLTAVTEIFAVQNGKIAFVSGRTGNGEIFVMNPDGSDQRNVSNNAAPDSSPRWLPNGSKIVFLRYNGSNYDVYMMSPDGSDQVKLTNIPSNDFSWSPDGTKIVYGFFSDIFVMNADGTNPTKLTNPNGFYDANPKFSPDGLQIVYLCSRPYNGTPPTPNDEVCVMNADGSNERNLTNHPAAETNAEWSPDGSKIAFASNRSGNNEIYVMNADGSNLINVSNNPASEGNPEWSPDGSKIAFATDRDGANNYEIYTMNADGSNQTRITNNTTNDTSPSWQHIASPAAAEGDLDLSFDFDGIVTNDNGNSGYDEITDVTVQSDGKIIAVGYSPIGSPSTNRTTIVRYNANGSIDSTFGASGKVVIEQLVSPQALALQADGKIVVVGSSEFFPNNNFFVARLNADGSLDTTFNGTGTVILDFGFADVADAIKIQPDGKIVAGGSSGNGITNSYVIVRFNPDGSLDTTFDGDGRVSTRVHPMSQLENFADLIIQPDGKIVGAGTARIPDANGAGRDSFVTVRYNPDGSLDTTFDGDGKAIAQIGGTTLSVQSVGLQSSGKIIVGGDDLIRYNPDGSLDSSFGTGGKVTTPVGSDIEIQSDNKIVLALQNGGVARYNVDGSPDLSFSGDGQNIIPFPPGLPAKANASAIQPDGKIVIGGFVGAEGARDFLLARFNASSCGTNCPVGSRGKFMDFDADGKTDLSVYRDGMWLVNPSSANNPNSFSTANFGFATDKLAPADYDSDGKTDYAVFRESPADPGKARFFILQSSNNEFREIQFGSSGDIPVSGDWDGDEKADIAVYRPGTQANPQGYFYYRPSSQSNVNFVPIPFGAPGDKPVVADYDGDGKADAAVFRPSNGVWYIQRSRDGFYAIQFGVAEDKPIVGDYDGDGKSDQAVFRPSNGVWYVWGSRNNSFSAAQFGISTDKPVPGDYDGDGKTDYAVYRDGTWFILNSTNGFAALGFGTATDKPVPNAFVP